MKSKDDRIIVANFWRTLPHELTESQLGWTQSDKFGVMSDDPETIFREYVDTMGLNMVFYYVDDGCFYEIFTEQLPVNVYRRTLDPTWDGRYMILSVIGGPSSHYGGELIYSTPDASTLWNELKIRGKSIGEVLERSVILTLD